MYIKSPYPDPPQLSEANAYHMLFERPDQSAWPTNFTAHIDAETGETLMHRDLISRIEALSTGLASPLSQGGLEVGSTELIGVIGENSSVRNTFNSTVCRSEIIVRFFRNILPCFMLAFELPRELFTSLHIARHLSSTIR